MIQRKQSLYLLAVAALMTLVLFVPLVTLNATQGVDTAVFDAWGIHFSNGEMEPLLYFGILIGLAAALAFVIITLYKKRTLQLRLCYALTMLLVGVVIFELLYCYKIYSVDAYTADFSPMLLIPIFCIPLVYLAGKGIIKDIALVKSYDRIR